MDKVYVVIKTIHGSGYYDEPDSIEVAGVFSDFDAMNAFIRDAQEYTLRNFPSIASLYDYDYEEVNFYN